MSVQKKQETPRKHYELVDRKSSGFIMDGTDGTPYQQELNAPTVQWIPSTGKMAIRDAKGTLMFQEIRYINGCTSIIPSEQANLGFSPKRFEDKIPMENGFSTVIREGDSIGLYDFMEKVFYNIDALDRPHTATGRFRELRIDKKATDVFNEDEAETHAKMKVYELRLNTGKKDTPYKYNEDRINAMCRLFSLWDETPERKLVLLLAKARSNPKEFLETVEKAEQTVITEITHALDLKVINFDGNNVLTDENTIIANLGSDKLKEVDKIERFASWLATHEGNNALTELRARIEMAKAKLL